MMSDPLDVDLSLSDQEAHPQDTNAIDVVRSHAEQGTEYDGMGSPRLTQEGKTQSPTEPELEHLRGELQNEFMAMRDDLDNEDMRRLTLFLYLIPVIGFLPAVWTLYRRLGDRHQQSVSRLSVTLAMGWLLSYLMVNLGATTTSPSVALPLLVVSSLLTSGYFLINIGLMIQLLRRKRLWVPGISRWSDRLP